MEILAVRLFEGRNVWSHSPILQARLLLCPREQIATSEIPDFATQLLDLLPGLAVHSCGRGYPGGFCERLQEGTYLGHVVEHLAIELQTAACHPVFYGKTVSGSRPDTWDIAFEYGTPALGKAALEAAVALVATVLDGGCFPIRETIEQLAKIGAETRPGPSTESIVRACRTRGIPVIPFSCGDLLQLGYGCCRKLVQATVTSQTSFLAVDTVGDKALTKQLLAEAGIPVPRGVVVTSYKEALAAVRELGYPVTVKPCRGNQGKGVLLNLTDESQLAAAYRIAQNYDTRVLVEKFIRGKHYRLLVIGGKLVAAAERLPASVTGDGVHSLQELVKMANQDERRGDGHEKPLTKLRIDPAALLELAKQGYTPDTCPTAGELVVLRENANLSTGGTSRDVTPLVHPENIYLAEQASRITCLDVAGVDLVTPDIGEQALSHGGAVIEVNAAPGFRMHLFPDEGEPRDVGRALVDYLFPPDSEGSIPVISITGTNGKTTTARLLAHLFQQQGMCTGMTTTGGIYVNRRCLRTGDTTGPASARAVLCDPTVEIAILETARGGILRGGLGYDRADVAVVTNIGPDHLGQDGIETLEDLFWVKSLVVEAVKDSGYVVLNADDPFAPRFADRARGEVVYFSLRQDNLLVRRHFGTGGCAVFVKDGSVYVGRGEQIFRIIGLKSIRSGMGGRAAHNLENALAAAAVSYVSGLSPALIRRGLRTFGTDVDHNPGRLTICHVGKVTVIVDYGHNAPAFRRIIEFARSLNPRRLLGVIGVPGDRRDDQIITAGEVAGAGCDEIFIKEDRDLRGRAPGETAQLLYSGARRIGKPASLLHIVTGETGAVKEALECSCPGDLVIIFYEELDTVMALLEEAAKVVAEKKAVSQNAVSQI